VILNNDSKYIQDWLDNCQNDVSKTFLMSCFSKSYEEILMWAHYSEKFYGCVIAFDFDEEKKFAGHRYDVKYRKKPVSIDAKYCYGYKNNNIILNALTTKYMDWKYEKEVRLIFPEPWLDSYKIDNSTIFGIAECSKYIKGFILGNRFSDSELSNSIKRVVNINNAFIKYGRLKAREYKVIAMDTEK
jgi:hypothetical protein